MLKVAGRAYRKPLLELLVTTWDHDAHIAAYVTPDVTVETAHGPREASGLRLRLGAETTIPGGYWMASRTRFPTSMSAATTSTATCSGAPRSPR